MAIRYATPSTKTAALKKKRTPEAASKSTVPPIPKAQRAVKTRQVAATLADLQTKGAKVVVAADLKAKEKAEGGKKLLSLRVDIDVIEKFKLAGKGWQGRMNAALRLHVGL